MLWHVNSRGKVKRRVLEVLVCIAENYFPGILCLKHAFWLFFYSHSFHWHCSLYVRVINNLSSMTHSTDQDWMMGATFIQTCQTCDDPYPFDFNTWGWFMMLLWSPLYFNNLIVEDVEISTLDISIENINRCQLIYMGFWPFCDLNSSICCFLFFPPKGKRKKEKEKLFSHVLMRVYTKHTFG